MEHRIEVCLELKNRISKDSNCIKSIITGDDTWFYEYDLESKVQSSQWKSANSPCPKNVFGFISNIKVMLTIFFIFSGLVHYEFLPKGQTVNQVFHKQVLERLREKVRLKRPETWKSKSWILHHDNVPAHPALFIREFLASKSIQVVPLPHIFTWLGSLRFFFYPQD